MRWECPRRRLSEGEICGSRYEMEATGRMQRSWNQSRRAAILFTKATAWAREAWRSVNPYTSSCLAASSYKTSCSISKLTPENISHSHERLSVRFGASCWSALEIICRHRYKCNTPRTGCEAESGIFD